MGLRLLPNWKRVATRAWSVRLMLVAAVLSGVEIILPLFVDFLPNGLFAVLSFLVTVAAFIARFVAQKNLTPSTEGDITDGKDTL